MLTYQQSYFNWDTELPKSVGTFRFLSRKFLLILTQRKSFDQDFFFSINFSSGSQCSLYTAVTQHDVADIFTSFSILMSDSSFIGTCNSNIWLYQFFLYRFLWIETQAVSSVFFIWLELQPHITGKDINNQQMQVLYVIILFKKMNWEPY